MPTRLEKDQKLVQAFLELKKCFKEGDLGLAEVLKSDINVLLLEYPFAQRRKKFIYFLVYTLTIDEYSLSFLKYLITQGKIDPYETLTFRFRDENFYPCRPYILIVFLCETLNTHQAFIEIFSYMQVDPNEAIGGSSLLFHALSAGNYAAVNALLTLGANPYTLYHDIANQNKSISKLPPEVKLQIDLFRLHWLKKFLFLLYHNSQKLNHYTENSFFGFRLKACNYDLKILFQELIVKLIKKINSYLRTGRVTKKLPEKSPHYFETMIVGILNSYLSDLTKRASVRYKEAILTFLQSFDKSFNENFILTQSISLSMFRNLMTTVKEVIQNDNQQQLQEEKNNLTLG